MNALIVDDERMARAELKRLLKPHADIVVVAEAANADEADARLAELAIDVMFLDISMPGRTGFDLLESLERVPLLIFTTAHDQHALRAFEANAFDYLLKPIRPERLASALDKTRAAHAAATRAGQSDALTRPRGPGDRVFLRDGERCWIVALTDIIYFEGEGNYARVHFGANRALIRSSLTALESRLGPAMFFRASRQHLINLRFVEHIEPGVGDSYVIRLRGGHGVPVSRRQSRKLSENLGL